MQFLTHSATYKLRNKEVSNKFPAVGISERQIRDAEAVTASYW
jgi:hypothetical protein